MYIFSKSQFIHDLKLQYKFLIIYYMLSNETNVRGISNVIKAEQFPLQTEIVLQQVLGNNVDQSIPIQVRPEQGYSNQQYVYSQYQPKQAGPQQQVVYMNNQAPQVVVIYATPMLTLEYQFINQYRWFNGCGCLQSIYMIFTLYLRSIAAFYLDQVPHVDQDSILVAKITGALYILQNVCWFGCLPIGLMGIGRFKIEFMRLNQIGLYFALLLELVSDFILFAFPIYYDKEFKDCYLGITNLERNETIAFTAIIDLFQIYFILTLYYLCLKSLNIIYFIIIQLQNYLLVAIATSKSKLLSKYQSRRLLISFRQEFQNYNQQITQIQFFLFQIEQSYINLIQQQIIMSAQNIDPPQEKPELIQQAYTPIPQQPYQQTIVVQPIYTQPKGYEQIKMERRFRQCNICYLIQSIISLVIRIAVYLVLQICIACGVFFTISMTIWIISSIIGLYGAYRNVPLCFKYYQYGMCLFFMFEIIGYIVFLAQFGISIIQLLIPFINLLLICIYLTRLGRLMRIYYNSGTKDLRNFSIIDTSMKLYQFFKFSINNFYKLYSNRIKIKIIKIIKK
ncbi:hypothetical protein pb186bvf_015420 [Paramecium bursaria]